MQTFCTIITADYFPKALVLYQSIRKFDESVTLVVLVTDNRPINFLQERYTGISIITIGKLAYLPLTNKLFEKYAHINPDYFRWALKPVLMQHLLQSAFERVIYADCDLFFVNDYQFLFGDLVQASIQLSPHWSNSNPFLNEQRFIDTFKYGVFNAGFIGANKNGFKILEWWANACYYKMGLHLESGIFDDQKYLDAIPALSKNVSIIHHKGCNVATWNRDECKRIPVNGELLINGTYKIIFIHFTSEMMKEILKGHESRLRPYFDMYNKLYEDNGFVLSTFEANLKKYMHASPIIRVKWKLKLRTRLKAFLHSLAEKL